MCSYRVFLANGLVKRVEFWEETPQKRFCKIRVEKFSAQRFYTSGDYSNPNDRSINVTKSIEKAVEGYHEDVVTKCTQAFALVNPTLGDVLNIFPGATVQFDRR